MAKDEIRAQETMTRTTLNNSIWTLSLVLQMGIAALLFRRRAAGRIPTFTLLILFYVLRSAGLFLLARYLTQPVYMAIYNDLAIIDLFLQLALAIEIELRILPIPGDGLPGQTLRRLALLVVLPVLAIVATILLSASVPAKAFVPTDRLQMFDSLFFILLGFWAVSRVYPIFLRRVSLGLAAYGLAAVASILGRTLAASHREINQYLVWTYGASIAYLLVFAFWFFALISEPALSAGHASQLPE